MQPTGKAVSTITIQQVLAEIIDTSNTKPFSLTWVRSTGKNRGSLKSVDQAVRGTSKGYNRKEPHKQSRRSREWVERGILPITDSQSNQFMTVKISHIVAYNGYQVRH